jgi:hypothetical protein
VRDYVLVAEHRKSGMSKLQVNWKDPRRVASVESNYVLVVENLPTKELKAAPSTRVRFYKKKELNVTAELSQAAPATRLRFFKKKELNVTAELAQAAEHNDHQLYVVSKILDARYI